MHTTDAFKSQLFISTTAWVFIILSSIILYFSITNLVLFNIIIDFQKEMFTEMQSSAEGSFSQKAQEIWGMMWIFLLVGMLSALALLVSAINLLKRRNWARILFTIVCLLIAALVIAAAFYLKYQAGEMGNLLKFNFSDDFAMGKIRLGNQIKLVTYLVFMVVVAWSMVKVLIKLNSQQIRAFFN